MEEAIVAGDGQEEAEAQAQAGRATEDEHSSRPWPWVAMLGEQLSSMYGYAAMGSAFNVLFAVGISALHWTEWKTAVPTLGSLAGSLMTSLIIPLSVALRTTLSIAAEDPYPNTRHFSWRYAPHCFISMLCSGCLSTALIYLLPKVLGATPSPEFYFTDIVAMVLMFTACVVFTAYVMKRCSDRDRRLGGEAQRRRDDGAAQHGREEAASADFGLSNILNIISIMFIIVGCE